MFADTTNGWRVGPSNGGPYLDSNLAAAPIDAGYRWPTAELWSTDDGGSSWKPALDGSQVDGLWGVDLLSAQHGWAVGVTGLLVTDDGGATWSSLPEPAAGNLVDVDFASPDTGWGVVTDGSLVVTSDGGDNWQVVATAPKAISSICLAKDVGYAVDQSGNLWRQPQGGDFEQIRQASEAAETPVWSVIDCTGSTVTASIEYPSLEGASTGYEVVASDDSGRSWSQVVSTLGKSPGPENAVVAPAVDLAGTSVNGGVALSLLPDGWGVQVTALTPAKPTTIGPDLPGEGTAGGDAASWLKVSGATCSSDTCWVLLTDTALGTPPKNQVQEFLFETSDAGVTWTQVWSSEPADPIVEN
jgi:photosystem II stability/assembly factor-like uncharacterized protein